MDPMEILGNAGLPTTFISAMIFVLFWIRKQEALVRNTQADDYERKVEENSNLRAELKQAHDELDKKDKIIEEKNEEIRRYKNRLWDAEDERDRLRQKVDREGPRDEWQNVPS